MSNRFTGYVHKKMKTNGWIDPKEHANQQIYKEAVDLLSKGSEILNEVAAFGNCECDIPNGKTCIPCECAMHNKAVATLLATVKGGV